MEIFAAVQLPSRCLILCDPIDYSTPGLPAPYHLLKFAQDHVHCIGDAIQPSFSDALFSFCPQSFPFMDHCLVVAKGPMSHAMSGHPRWIGYNREF